jgi:hypothetical protein
MGEKTENLRVGKNNGLDYTVAERQRKNKTTFYDRVTTTAKRAQQHKAKE